MNKSKFHNLKAIVDNKLTYQNLLNQEKPLKTGFSKLDKVLEGGITPGLIVLGAGPGQGKSTVALQLAEYVSSKENVPVLYFSLEMSQQRLAAKAVTMDSFRYAKAKGLPNSRISSIEKATEHFFTASELFNLEKLENMSDEKRRQLEQAQLRTAQNENLYIIDNPYCAREIVEQVNAFLKGQENQVNDDAPPSKKPLVIIDYLQIIPPDPEKKAPATDKQQVDLNLKLFRELVLQQVPVLLISSLKRGNYSGKGVGPMKMDSFKETGGIEYSADVLMGLQFTACHGPEGCDPDMEKTKFPRDMELVVLKQRYGDVCPGVPMWYYAAFDYLEEKSAVQQAPTVPEDKSATATSKPAEATKAQPEDNEKEQPEKTKEVQPEKKDRAKAYMNNTKIAYEIRNGHWKSGEFRQCNVAGRGNDAIYTKFMIEGTLTHFDCDVADAVYSLHCNGYSEFLPRHVLHALTGDEKQTLTEEKSKEIQNSLDNLCAAKITIECTEQMLRMKKKPELLVGGKVEFTGQFLNLKKEKGKYIFIGNGTSGSMPLYHYGELTRQMIAFPLRLLSVRPDGGRKISDTADNIMIKRYLIRRLEVIRNGRASALHMRKITYYNRMMGEDSGMLAAMGEIPESIESAAWQNKLRKTHKTVTAILKYFKQKGYISGFEEKKPTGVEIVGPIQNPYTL